jgi:hypothetical protein
MTENFQAQESREGVVEDRWERLSIQEVQGQADFWSSIEGDAHQAAVLKDRPREKHPRSPPRWEMDKMHQRDDTRRREEVQHEHPSVAPSIPHKANHHTWSDPAF